MTETLTIKTRTDLRRFVHPAAGRCAQKRKSGNTARLAQIFS
jgi:hypothetical protein